MRALILYDSIRESISRVRFFAEKPENYYRIEAGGWSFQRPPGDDPRHVVIVPVDYRCVFSISVTVADGKKWRHLSISVPRPGKYPSVAAAFCIADAFGFAGWDEDKPEEPPITWRATIEHANEAIMLVEEIQ